MKTINLRTYYSFIYPHDTYCDVPNKVASLLMELKRKEHAYYERQRINHAYYSLDMNDGIEQDIVLVVLSPQEIYEEKLGRNALYSAILKLPEKQMKRIYAHYFLGMGFSAIARQEGINKSVVSRSIHQALKNLRRELSKFDIE